MVTLIVLDGYGHNLKREGNAVYWADTPNLDSIFRDWPNTLIKCSGLDVGLPPGQMGNSEVGHMNMGAGRVVYQDLTRVTKSIEDGDFFDKKEFSDAINNCVEKGTDLHLMGLLSDGGVHSHNTHLYALLDLLKSVDFDRVFVHCFFDGRDVPPDSAHDYLALLIDKMEETGIGKIATIMGRYYAMDRDNRWERVKLAHDAMVAGKGILVEDALLAVKGAYEDREFDEFIRPRVVVSDGKPVGQISRDDSVIFFNFRPDRAREITRAFTDPDFNGFEREGGYFPLKFVCFTQYDKTMKNVSVAFKPQTLKNTLGEYVADLGLKQLRIAETEKYAHVTFFFNGGIEKVYEGEDRVLIPSPQVATYDLKPEMSAYEVCDEVLNRIRSKDYDLIILNFANPDMVGHTGVFESAVEALEAVDECVGKIIGLIREENQVAIITSDHGNAEQMIDYQTGGPFTAHTSNPVPLALVGREVKGLKGGNLADIAPTLLDLLGVEKPEEMTGESLIII